MECKNVHPNQSDLNQGPWPSFSPPLSVNHIGHLVHLPAGFSRCLSPKPATGSNAQNWVFYFPRYLFATMAERMYSPSPFYDWSMAFFFPQKELFQKDKELFFKNCSSRDCAHFSQLQMRWVKLSSSLLTFECAILGPMTRDFNASSASAPSHPLPLLYVYMLHNYRVVGIYHLFWAVSRKTHNTITSSYCLSQDN